MKNIFIFIFSFALLGPTFGQQSDTAIPAHTEARTPNENTSQIDVDVTGFDRVVSGQNSNSDFITLNQMFNDDGTISFYSGVTNSNYFLYGGLRLNTPFVLGDERFAIQINNHESTYIHLDGPSDGIGIGTFTPAAKLDVAGQIKATTTAGATGLNLSASDSYADLRVIRNTLNSVDSDLFFNFGAAVGSKLHFYSDGLETMTVAGNQLLVGTTVGATGFKVSVDGKIACEEVLIDMNGDWPDYVFAPDYELKTLNEVRKYISEKGHLPGVPSAQEVEENGILLGGMNKILMEKVEELTLYILQQEDKNQLLQDDVNALIERIEDLESNKK